MRADGIECGHRLHPTWDYCPVHAERRGEELLRETPERVVVEVALPRFALPLRGWSRSEWEGIRLALGNVVLPDYDEPHKIKARREARERLGVDLEPDPDPEPERLAA